MNLAIESTVIFPVLRKIDHAFVGTIKGSVEDFFFVFRTAFYHNLAQCLVPYPASGIRHRLYIIGGDVTLQILLCLLGTDKGNSVT